MPLVKSTDYGREEQASESLLLRYSDPDWQYFFKKSNTYVYTLYVCSFADLSQKL